MDRRGILKSLVGLPVVALPVTLSASAVEPHRGPQGTLTWLNRQYIYGTGSSAYFAASAKVYTIRFTFWKVAVDNDFVAAQWIAVPRGGTRHPDQPGFSSSTPGRVAKYWPGYCMDITPEEGQVYLTGDDFLLPQKELLAKAREAARQAFGRLIEEIESAG